MRSPCVDNEVERAFSVHHGFNGDQRLLRTKRELRHVHIPSAYFEDLVAETLMDRSVPVEGNMNLVVTTLTRRVKNGLLKTEKAGETWIYWTEQTTCA